MIDTLDAVLRERIPEIRSTGSSEMKANIRYIIRKARAYGFSEDAHLTVFVVTAAYLGTEFDTEFPPVAAVLAASDMSHWQKSEWLEEFTTTLMGTLEAS